MRMLPYVAVLRAFLCCVPIAEAGKSAAPDAPALATPAKPPPFWLPAAERKPSIEEMFCFKAQGRGESDPPIPEQDEVRVKNGLATPASVFVPSIFAGSSMGILFFAIGIGGWMALGVSALILGRRQSRDDHPSLSS